MRTSQTSWLTKLISFAALSVTVVGVHGFDPKAYHADGSRVAICDAVERTATFLHTDGIFKTTETFTLEKEEIINTHMSYIDINPTAEKTILMVHGWPGMWSTWGYQIEEFKNDFRLIVPNLRGFGNSTLPGNVRYSGTMQDIISDMACVLKHAGVDQVTCMGHDWGSMICHEMARARPDMTSAVVSVTIPYVPAASSFTYPQFYARLIPRFMYQVLFDENADKAAAELDTDIRRSLRAIYRSLKRRPPSDFYTKRDTVLGPFGSAEIPPIIFLSNDEEDYLVEQFEIQGFKNTLYSYAIENRYLSWKIAHEQGNHTISQPVLTIYASDDYLVNWKIVAFVKRSSKYLPNLTTETITGDHFPHMESPEAFNAVVRKWMSKVGVFGSDENERIVDEL